MKALSRLIRNDLNQLYEGGSGENHEPGITDIDKIARLCTRLKITKFNIHNNGVVDVNGDVNLIDPGFLIFPFTFGKIKHDFVYQDDRLETMLRFPQEVGGSFMVTSKNLENLMHSPQNVGKDFVCSDCKFSSGSYLQGAPNEIKGDFDCTKSELISLFGVPKKIGGNLLCSFNKLVTLKYFPESIGGNFTCMGNIDLIPTSFINILGTNIGGKISTSMFDVDPILNQSCSSSRDKLRIISQLRELEAKFKEHGVL